MKHLALFENWEHQSDFPLYNKQIKLFNLGLAPTPFKNPDSAAFAEFLDVLRERLADMNMTVEIERTDEEERAWITLEVEARNSESQPVYLRFRLMPNSQNAERVYLITANYLREKSVNEPAEIIDSMIELINKILAAGNGRSRLSR